MFESFADSGRCTLVFRPNATLDEIYAVLNAQRDRIAIFHYGGHADDARLMLDSALGPSPAFGEGLATLLGQQRGLRLVFLNGCSTRPQVQRLLDSGVPAVIATARPIDDRVAREFAVAFYEALTTGGPEVRDGGRSLRGAFEAARGLASARHGGAAGAPARDMVVERPDSQDVTDAHGFPWDFFVRKGADRVERWDLFEEDPLFGLPPLPAGIGLPDEPFRKLEWFGREHARIFFGRGRAIRELYDLLSRPASPGEASVLLYYGQTGVGKTSVLAAGLLPRAEERFQVRYVRRSPELGLLGTLRGALDPGAADRDPGAAWRAIESGPDGRPLVVVLDQAEEAFTRPRIADGPAPASPKIEVEELVEAARTLFDPTRADRPRGKLILGFRKEWLDEFEKACKAMDLAFESVPLSPLDRAGVIEAVEGPSREPRYRLKVVPDRGTAPPGEVTLAEFVADDLLDTLADPKVNTLSPVAPTLQILLTRMWADARERDRERPTFDRPLYTSLKDKGYQLGEVLDQQLAAIARSEPEAVRQGLALDLLETFTTSLGTAASRTRGELSLRYSGLSEGRLDGLLRRCQDHYLLVETRIGAGDAAAYRLVHDTLAPLVRERFRVSSAPAQRARRVLEGRAPDWKGRPNDPVLDRFDLEVVEDGLPWMRALEEAEVGLLDASRGAEADRVALEQGRRQFLRGLGIAAAVAALLAFSSAIVAWRQAGNAMREKQTSDRLKNEAEEKEYNANIRLAQNPPEESDRSRSIDLLWRYHPRRHGDFKHRGFEWNYLWRKTRLHAPPLRGQSMVTRLAWSPDGKRIATQGEDNRTRVWDVDSGEKLYTLFQLGNQPADVLGWSSDGRRLVVGVTNNLSEYRLKVIEGDSGAVLHDLDRDIGEIYRTAWSPAADRVAAVTPTELVLCDAKTGERRRFLPHEKHEFGAAAWSPDGKRLAIVIGQESIGLWPIGSGSLEKTVAVSDKPIAELCWSADGSALAIGCHQSAHIMRVASGLITRLPATPERSVRRLAWSPDGTRVAAIVDSKEVKLWDPRDGGEAATLRVSGHKGFVSDIAWLGGSTRLATASQDNLVRVWDVETANALDHFEGTGQRMTLVTGSPDGRLIAGGSDDGVVRVWDPRLRAERRFPMAAGRLPYTVQWSPDGLLLAGQGGDRVVRTWDAETGAERDALKAPPGDFTLDGMSAIRWTDRPGVLFFGSDGEGMATQKALWWDAARGKILSRHQSAKDSVNWAVPSSNLERVAVLYKDPDRAPEVWDLASGEVHILPHPGQPAASIYISPGGRYVATVHADSTARIHDVASRVVAYTADMKEFKEARNHVSWSPDEKILVVRNFDNHARLFDAPGGRRLIDLTNMERAPSWSPDGAFFAHGVQYGGAVGGVRLWRNEVGYREVYIPIDDNRLPVREAWTPSGDRLTADHRVNISSGHRLVAWEPRANKEVFSLSGLGEGVGPRNWTPSGNRVVTLMKGGGFRIWNGFTGVELLDIKSTDGGVRRWLWSPDGQQFATVGADGIEILDGRPLPP